METAPVDLFTDVNPEEAKKYRRFRARLEASRKAVNAVAEYLKGRGHEVEVPEIKITPNVFEAANFFDVGDILIRTEGRWRRIEVKGANKLFKCREEWPHKNMFVASVASVDRAKDVWAYFTTSSDLAYAGIIMDTTRPHWYRMTALAPNTGRFEYNYACPIGFVRFIRLK
jgi:hypothetical protein